MKKYTVKEKRAICQGLLFISPWLIGVIGFTLIPLLLAFGISLTDYNFLTEPKFVGLENYITMFTKDPLIWKSLGITLLYAVISVPLQLAFGFLLANLLNQKLRGILVFRTLFYAPCLVAVVSSTLLWKQMLETEFGIINYLLGLIGIDKVSWLGQTGTIIASVVFISLWQSGKMIIINLAGLQAIPTVYYEAADLDGCTRWRQAFYITLPLMSPTIFMNLLIGLIGAFKTFTQIKILTDGGPDNASLVYMLYIYKTAFTNYKLGYANAMSILLFVIVGILTVFVFRTSNKWVHYGSE
ncbi:MAG: carbohydrate ABC transporter permease [Marvinbryantia sp.]|uniref:carbohydrate ABC transporter permease n=1 Tax=Marvinbryantia sp. TaxID=2496532 RepID=UPI0025FB9EBA|nr:sugar ABC transporter permease [uncultured Marvinbryantia sp.]